MVIRTNYPQQILDAYMIIEIFPRKYAHDHFPGFPAKNTRVFFPPNPVFSRLFPPKPEKKISIHAERESPGSNEKYVRAAKRISATVWQ